MVKAAISQSLLAAQCTLGTGEACMYLDCAGPRLREHGQYGHVCSLLPTRHGGTDCAAGQACTASLEGLPMGIGLCGASMI